MDPSQGLDRGSELLQRRRKLSIRQERGIRQDFLEDSGLGFQRHLAASVLILSEM